MKYRLKTQEVEARQFINTMDEIHKLEQWCDGTYSPGPYGESFALRTPGGIVRLMVGDWVLKIGDEFYFYDHEGFEKDFEVVK